MSYGQRSITMRRCVTYPERGRDRADRFAAGVHTPCQVGFRPTRCERSLNGQWTIDSTGYVVCKDGRRADNAASTHYTWDPNTLAGRVQVIQNQAVCGHAPQSYTVSVQLRHIP